MAILKRVSVPNERDEREQRGASLLRPLLAGAALLASGCAEDTKEADDIGASTQQALTKSEPLREKISPHPIVAKWNDPDPMSRDDVLHATVRNTVDEDVEVALRLMAKGPKGRVVFRSLGTENIPAGQSRSVAVSVADVPIQSVGAATFIQLLAKYEMEQRVVLGPPTRDPETRMLQLTARTHLSRHVTFDPGFGAATIRAGSAQSEENLRAHRDSATGPVLTALRIYDESSGAYHHVDPSDSGPDRRYWGVESTFSAPLEELPPRFRDALGPLADYLANARAAAAQKEAQQ